MQTNRKIEITRDEILSTAREMREGGHLLICIHAHVDKQGETVVTYDYDCGAEARCYEVRGEKALPSIVPIYDAAAEWAERELCELMDLTFEGLDTSERLFLPDNLLDGQGQIIVTPVNVLRERNHPEGEE